MKKITCSFCLFFMMVLQGYSQVSIGEGTSTNKHVPIEAHSDFSYAQSIYLASEIATSGYINSVKWYFSGATSDDWNMQGLDYSQDIKIYFGNTTKTEFSSNEDWVAFSELAEGYSGGITVDETGWVTIDLEVPFFYNGTDNLVIAVKESMVGADPADADFWAFQVPTNRSISSYGFELQDPEYPPYADYLGNYVPNIVLGGIIQVCPHPENIFVTDITTSSVTLNWDTVDVSPNGGTQYYISENNIDPEAATFPTGSVASGSENIAAVTSGLNSGTVYYVWLRDVCDTVPGNWSNPVSFVTACLPISTFSQDFDASEDLPLCWSTILRGDDLSEYAQVGVVTWESNSGENSIEFYNDESGEDSEMILVSAPVGNLAAGTHRLKFFASTYGESHLNIGTLSSNSQDAVFNGFEDVTVVSGFNEYIVDFTIYNESEPNFHIGIRLDESSPYTSLYIDDIRWEVAPPCADITLITVPSTTTTTAAVSWTPTGNETTWEVVSAPINVTSPEGLTPIEASIDPTATIGSLEENTSYNVWVRSACEGGFGIWVGPIAFTTTCSAVNTFNENFDSATTPDLPNCWTKILRGPSIGEDAYLETIGTGINSGPNGVVMNNGFSSPASDDVILVSPNLGNLAAGTHRLKFFGKKEGDDVTLEIGTLNSNTNSAVFTVFDEVTLTDDAVQYAIDFSSFVDNDGEEDTYIGIRMASSGQFLTAYLDDIKWEVLPACPDPAGLSASGIANNSATLVWSAGGTETQWQIAYGDGATVDPTTLSPSPVLTTATHVLEDLEDNTTYKVWVRSVCISPDANGEWVGPYTFTTACIPSSYLSENFNAAVTPALPGCWSAILRGDTISSGAYVSTVGSQPFSAPSVVRMNNADSSQYDDIILVSPKLNNLSAGTHRLKFFSKRSGFVDIKVGTLDSNTDSAVFTSFQNIEMTSNYTEYIVDFTSYGDSDTYIGIRMNSDYGYNSVYIDDIVWEPAPLCPDLTNLEVTSTTTSTANVAWEAGSSLQFQVAYGLASVTDPFTLTPGDVLDDASAEITGLESNTIYKFWVRSVCGAPDGNGAWIGPMEFTTKCLSTNPPYIEDFENVLVPLLPNCSSFVNEGEANNWLTNYPVDYESIALTYGGSNVPANAWYFTQGINLIQGTNYTISYDYGNRGVETSESFKVMSGIAPDAASMTLPLADHPAVANVTIENNVVSFTAPTTGIYYFGFNAYSIAQQDVLIVDNISIQSALSNGEIQEGNFTYYPNPVRDVLHISYTEEISKIVVYNILGQNVLERIIDSRNAQIDMSDLGNGTYIVKVSSDEQTKIIKVVRK